MFVIFILVWPVYETRLHFLLAFGRITFFLSCCFLFLLFAVSLVHILFSAALFREFYALCSHRKKVFYTHCTRSRFYSIEFSFVIYFVRSTTNTHFLEHLFFFFLFLCVPNSLFS